jgi:mitochondrial fission protein ELM1
MTDASESTQRASDPALPFADRVWVLDDPQAGFVSPALAIAERLGVPFQRVALFWNWKAHLAMLSRRGSLVGVVAGARRAVTEALPRLALADDRPGLVISAGNRAATVALWLKARSGCRVVHCLAPGIGAMLRGDAFDLLVIPEHDRPPAAPNILPVLGAPHRLSPLMLRQARSAWTERLAHMPRPRVALLIGGPLHATDMPPALAHGLARKLARLVSERRGSVLATSSRRTGEEATEALAAGLGRVLHVLYRWGEPGDNPYAGFLASADAIVVTADSIGMISEACATGAPVYIALPELAGPRQRRLLATLQESAQVRLFKEDLSPWPRTPLDEAERVAAEIRRRFPLD